MEWISGYAAIAVLVATASIVVAEWARDAHVAAPDRPGTTAIVAGLLWPVVAVGLVQLLAVVGVRHGLRVGRQSARHRPESRMVSASLSTTRGSWGNGR